MPTRPFLANLLSLYGVQAANLVIPLVTLPYLARTLGPAQWGQLAAAQALGLTLSLVVEYGFAFSATRQVALHQNDMRRLGAIASGVLGAKVLLTGAMVLLGTGLVTAIPGFRESPALMFWAIVYAAAQGFSPLWYFQGTEQLRVAAMIDVAAKVAATLLVFLLVTAPPDAWLVLALQATLIACAQVINLLRMYRQIPFLPPTLSGSWRALQDGASMFLFRGAVSLYTTANAALLRLFVPSIHVAYYANADRLANAGRGLVQPVTQLLFPRISYLSRHDMAQARRLMRRSFTLLLGLSVAVAVGAALVAPWFIPWFFGEVYRPTTRIFQMLCVTFPLVTVSSVLGLQWMVPNGLDRAFNTIILMGGAFSLSLLVLLVPRQGELGMAWAVILSEAGISLAMFVYLHMVGKNPLTDCSADAEAPLGNRL